MPTSAPPKNQGRRVNMFFQLQTEAKKNNAEFFEYKGSTYRRLQGGKNGKLIYYAKSPQ